MGRSNLIMSYKRYALIATAVVTFVVASNHFMKPHLIDLQTENQFIQSNIPSDIELQTSKTKNQSPGNGRHEEHEETHYRHETNYYACIEQKKSGAKGWTNNTQKVNHIMFLKVHKAGSTTMENIFFRFGLRHNLTFVLPKTGVYVLAGGDSDEILPLRKGAHYDILASHSVYNSTKMDLVLPANSVKNEIVREPLDRMVSAAYYYRDRGKPYLLEVPKKYFVLNLIRNQSVYEKNEFSNTKNSIAKDFGFPTGIAENMTKSVSSYISKLVADFRLVLIMEKFEESLILMKRVLNWGLSDVLFIAANSHKHDKIRMDQEDLTKFKSMCFLDYAIYERFLDIFESKIMLEGNDFIEEVEHFKNVLNSVRQFCYADSDGAVLKIDESQWNCPFIVTYTDCRVMKMDVNFISFPILREKHLKMHGL